MTQLAIITTLIQAFTTEHSALAARWDTLEANWQQLRGKMAAVQEEHGEVLDPDGFVHLNVGGKPIDVRRSTLTCCINSRLSALFSGRWERVLRRDDASIFIDDNAKCFKKMLTSLQSVKGESSAHLNVPEMEEDLTLSGCWNTMVSMMPLAILAS